MPISQNEMADIAACPSSSARSNHTAGLQPKPPDRLAPATAGRGYRGESKQVSRGIVCILKPIRRHRLHEVFHATDVVSIAAKRQLRLFPVRPQARDRAAPLGDDDLLTARRHLVHELQALRLELRRLYHPHPTGRKIVVDYPCPAILVWRNCVNCTIVMTMVISGSIAPSFSLSSGRGLG